MWVWRLVWRNVFNYLVTIDGGYLWRQEDPEYSSDHEQLIWSFAMSVKSPASPRIFKIKIASPFHSQEWSISTFTQLLTQMKDDYTSNSHYADITRRVLFRLREGKRKTLRQGLFKFSLSTRGNCRKKLPVLGKTMSGNTDFNRDHNNMYGRLSFVWFS